MENKITFGLIKENIIADFVSDTTKKVKLKNFIKTIKETKNLKKLYNFYNLVLECNIKDKSLIGQYIVELHKNTNKTTDFDYKKELHITESIDYKSEDGLLYEHIENIYFNKYNLKKTYVSIEYLTNYLHERNNSNESKEQIIEDVEVFQLAQEKLNNKLEKLSESNKKIINILSTNNIDEKVKGYIALRKECIEKLNEKMSLVESEDKKKIIKEAEEKIKSKKFNLETLKEDLYQLSTIL